MLSSQTKDQITAAAMERLKSLKNGLTPETIRSLDLRVLSEILCPVGFYRRKAEHLMKTAEILKREYNDDIPDSLKDLVALPGVGPKMVA